MSAPDLTTGKENVNFIKEAIESALESAYHDRKLWTGAIADLRAEHGDPRQIAKREKWLAEAVEAIVQYRAFLGIEGPE